METRFISLLDQNVKIITNKTVSDPYKYTFFDSFTNEQGHETQNLAAKLIVPNENEPLAFTAYNDDFTLSFYDLTSSEEIEDIIDSFGLHFQYSYNKKEWFDWDSETRNVTIEDGSTVYLKGNNPNGINSSYEEGIYFHFEANEGNDGGIVECHGNIMSLLGKSEKDIPCDYCFTFIFTECEPLTTAPELPATTLTKCCYSYMFSYCPSLTTAPELPATTLAVECYSNMFQICTSLVNAPELPATTLIGKCYNTMFQGCTSLSSVTCLAESGISKSGSTSNWLSNVSSEGVFIKSANAVWPSGENGIPDGWTEQTAS